ncbi:uncharacterized protein LOC116338709 [Contarinia nasturtii]|uniref:uncharacterized protein LOC116338709 n=1 Tax=Contarinia nasturtii TaxID=265458 RepID=UPI0012D44DE5|nr:uncharacterized protein LOC116338709 [Contarinia nasturtii]
MLTRRKRIGIDSSPKTSISKNAHLLTKKTMQDSANMLSTPPTRRNRFMLGNSNANVINDDSPVLSQETINIAWKWKSDTPNRPTNKTSKLKRTTTNGSIAQISSLQRFKRNSKDNQTATTSSPILVAEPETHSPKGLYKFQEEMRKMQADTESDTSCDNIYNDKSNTESDTGYPNNLEGAAHAYNAGCSDNLDVSMQDGNVEPPKMTSTQNCTIGDNLADDLLNDSDFDHILLTCKMPVQATAPCEQTVSESNRSSVKKANSAPEIKASGSGSTSSGSNWNLVDDFDDLVKDIDFDEDITGSLNTSAKFTRHKSMPQQPQKPSTSSSTTPKTFKPQQSKYVDNTHLNRKSFTRHESMPITNRLINPSTKNNNISAKQHSAFPSTQEKKCTKEEIAEKRRQAIERLKNRQKQVKVST